MDDMRSFEDRLAEELGLMAGPEPPVDALAVSRSVAAQAPKRRLQIMFSATKFVLAGAIVALFGGFLLAGILTTQDEAPPAPAAETAPAAQVSGTVDSAAVPRPSVHVRLVVRLVDRTATDDGSGSPLATPSVKGSGPANGGASTRSMAGWVVVVAGVVVVGVDADVVDDGSATAAPSSSDDEHAAAILSLIHI